MFLPFEFLLQTVLPKFFIYTCALIYLHVPGVPFVNATVKELLDEGTHLLSSGRLGDALSLYNQAVGEDPKNHMVFFRRGTAHLAMGNTLLALPDFDEAVRLNPHYFPAIKHRGQIYVKMGNLDKAKEDFELLFSTYNDRESGDQLELIQRLKVDFTRAKDLYENSRWKEALNILGRMIDVMPMCPELREMRAQCYVKLGDLKMGINEMRHSVHLLNDNRDGLLALGQLMYDSGLAVQAIEEIRACLRLDQDHDGCKKLYRKLKKLSAALLKAQSSFESSSYADCIENANQVVKLEPSHMDYQYQAKVLLCQCHARSHSEDALTFCKDVAEKNPDNLDFQCDLAESYINADQFDKAIEVCQRILNVERRHPRARDLIKKAQNLLKAKKRPDYYKILGVSRTATKQEIARAYRKKARTLHPDKYEGEKKEEAQAQFLQLSSAKEVLMDDEKRQRYDNGEDPLDPNQEQQYSNPFGPFGGFTFANMHPFGGGGHFEFHFG